MNQVKVTVMANDGVEAIFTDGVSCADYYWNKFLSPYPLPQTSQVPSEREFLRRFPIGGEFFTLDIANDKEVTPSSERVRIALWGEPKREQMTEWVTYKATIEKVERGHGTLLRLENGRSYWVAENVRLGKVGSVIDVDFAAWAGDPKVFPWGVGNPFFQGRIMRDGKLFAAFVPMTEAEHKEAHEYLKAHPGGFGRSRKATCKTRVTDAEQRLRRAR